MEASQKKRTALMIALPVLAALIVGLAMWALMSLRIGSIEEERDSALSRIEELESEVDALSEQLATDGTTDEEAAEDETPPSEDASEDTASEDGRHFCFVTDVVDETGTPMIIVDYADLLTGSEAAAAAAAAGAESPPPNDYWISNVNPKLRTFPVRSGIIVRLTSTSEGTNPDGYTVTLGQWQDFFTGMSPGMEVVRDVPYWIIIENGEVTSIEEQYLP